MISSPSASSSNSLAPGFRFHPTDEELVSYYLKRKVSGLPLRVDAIAEIDLYKCEPWDLPPLSRLRSRDVEWYFFSPLDRKYSNRLRTNRATKQGYWKTTGKDRPVKHASRIVGMKKTLVFHAGRAPKGARTNWVMHEYRLEDPETAAADPASALAFPQGSFVVCRIFQKSGSGPQNGAQYGAPFIEEEWEQPGEFVPKSEAMSDAILYAGGEQEHVHADDFVKEQALSDEHESTILVAKSEEDGGSHADDPTIFLEDVLDLDTYIDLPEVQNNPNNPNAIENSGVGKQTLNPSHQNDGYLELRDIFDDANDLSNSFGDRFEVQNDHFIDNSSNDATTWSEVGGNDFCFDIANGTASPGELNQMSPPAESVFNLQPLDYLNPVSSDYPSVQPIEDNILFYDASSNNPHAGDIFENTEGIQFPSAADFDMVDDLMAYFDATDNNLQYDIFNSSDTVPQPSSVSEVKDDSSAPYKVPEMNMDMVASSSARFIGSGDQLESMDKYTTTAPGMQVTEGWNKSLKQRVVNMLGSISAPPAMALGSVKGKEVVLSAAHSSSSVHVTMIQIQGTTVMGSSAEYWTLQKKGDTSFLLSHGMAGKSVCVEPNMKVQGGAFGMLLRGGFYLFGLCVLILSASLKIGLCVHNK